MSLWKCWPRSSRQNPPISCFRDLILFCFFYPVASWFMIVFCRSKNSCLSISRMTILVSISVDCFEIFWKWRLGLSCGETCPKLSLRQNEPSTALPALTLLVCTGKTKESTNSCYREILPKGLNYICPVPNATERLHTLFVYATERNKKHRELLTTLHLCNILVTPEKTINWLNI